MALFTALVGLLLTGAFLGPYFVFSHVTRAQFDQHLLDAAQPVLAELMPDPSENTSDPSDTRFEDDVTKLDIPGEYFAIYDANNHLMQQSLNLSRVRVELGELPPLDSGRRMFYNLKQSTLGKLRAVSVPFQIGTSTYFLVLAMPDESTEAGLLSLRRLIFISLPLGLLITALVSIWYVSRSLRPIGELTRHAIDMTARLDATGNREIWTPLPVENPDDELGRLAEAFNRLFQRVDSSVRQLRQFVTDASHELRTPLTVLQGETEFLLSKRRTEHEYRAALTTIDEELNTLGRIVKGLFTLSLADAGQLRLGRELLYLNEVLEDSCALAEPLASAKGIKIDRKLNNDVPFYGDETFLRQLFVIFLDNAIKYSPSGTDIRVSLSIEERLARIRFEDSGVGIAAEHVAGIFRRFNRGGQTGSTEGQGGGLGLPIAQAIARAHDGSIQCESTLGEGSVFTVTLPVDNASS